MKLLTIVSLLIFGFQGLFAQDGNLVETNGVKIYYETHGKGEPLLLLHGFSVSHKAWDNWVEDLSKDYLVITPDLRGHGNSTNPSRIFTHELAAQDMYGLMDAIHGDRDGFFPVDIPVSFYEAIPNSYLWIVPNDGHVPIGIYDRNSIWSDVFLIVLKEFFNGSWK